MAGRLSKVYLPEDLPCYFTLLSRIFCKAMNTSGISAEQRDITKEMYNLFEILISLIVFHWPEYSVYICGSQFETTSLDEINSDFDWLLVDEEYPVVKDKSEAQQYPQCCLMVQDPSTSAGYVKLQFVVNGVPLYGNHKIRLPGTKPNMTGLDKDGRIVLQNIDPIQASQYEKHGPAFYMTSNGLPTGDLVFAVRCRSWTDYASEWSSRERHPDWSLSGLFEKCKSLSCFFVHVGHPASPEEDKLWRVSFTLQERLLVTHFYSTQQKCYVYLKFIKVEKIQTVLHVKSLTSYHLKTCMFYMIESTPAGFWVEENLLTCVYNCLQLILKWSEYGVFPNYFIPDENMLDGRVDSHLRSRLCEVLRKLMEGSFLFLPSLKKSAFNIAAVLDKTLDYTFLSGLSTSLLRNKVDKSKFLTFKVLNDLQFTMKEAETVGDHTLEETKRAVSFVMPYIDLGLVSTFVVYVCYIHLFVKYTSTVPVNTLLVYDILRSKIWDKAKTKSDQFTSKLKQSSFLYVLGYLSDSLKILLDLDNIINEQLVSFCACPENKLAYIKAKELFNMCVIPCVHYPQIERALTPQPLIYAFERLPPSTLSMVDGKILLYVLLYLNHKALGMKDKANADIVYIKWFIENDKLLGHRDVACNILWWIYTDQGQEDNAIHENKFIESTQLS